MELGKRPIKPVGLVPPQDGCPEPHDREEAELRPSTPGPTPLGPAQRPPPGGAVRVVRCLSEAPAQWAAARGAEAL